MSGQEHEGPDPIVAEEEETPFRWRDLAIEDYVVFVVFWFLAVDIFVQFFTRYVLNSSLAWTEEIARYLLIGVGFIGGIMAVRKDSHIMVEFLYRYISPGFARLLSVVVDAGRIAFFAMSTWICFRLAGRTHQMMVSIDFPKSAMYYIISVCFFFMTVRAAQVAARHWRQGGSDMSLRHSGRITIE